MRFAQRLLALAAVSLLFLALPAVAGASIRASASGFGSVSSQTGPGQDTSGNEFDEDDNDNGVVLVEVSNPGCPPTPPCVMPQQEGTAFWRGFASGDESAGRLEMAAFSDVTVFAGFSDDSATGAGNGDVGVQDSIILSEPATVTVRGNLSGSVVAEGSDPAAVFDGHESGTADAHALVGFFLPCPPGPPFCEVQPFGGYSRDEDYQTRYIDSAPELCPALSPTSCGSGPIDEDFEVAVSLPAGETSFSAELRGRGDGLVFGGSSQRSAGGESDFESTLSYEIVVPEGVTATSESGRLPIVQTDAECSDGVDNDADGRVDFPADRQCESASDPSERAQCADGLDNDGDGQTDYPADPGCSSARNNSEAPNPQCSDGVDNDGDGATDYPGDLGCRNVRDSTEAPNPQCSDGVDNDGDGATDYPGDPGCRNAGDGTEAPNPQCSDGVDNDGDGVTDHPGDPGCRNGRDNSENTDNPPAGT